MTLPNASYRVCHPKKSYSAIIPNSGVFLVDRWEEVDTVDVVEPIGFDVEFRAEKIDKRSIGIKSNPCITFKAKPYLQPDSMRVHKTEVQLNARSCEFKPFTMEMSKYGGWDSIIEMEIWDQDKKGRFDFIGSCKTTLREMSYYKTNPRFVMINLKKKGNIGYRHSGLLYICQFKPIAPPEEYNPVQTQYDQVEMTITNGNVHNAGNVHIQTAGHASVQIPNGQFSNVQMTQSHNSVHIPNVQMGGNVQMTQSQNVNIQYGQQGGLVQSQGIQIGNQLVQSQGIQYQQGNQMTIDIPNPNYQYNTNAQVDFQNYNSNPQMVNNNNMVIDVNQQYQYQNTY
jgi:hypothetical protein